MGIDQFPSRGEKPVHSFNLRVSNHDPDNLIAFFPGLGSLTFIFDPVTHEIVHEAFEATDSHESGPAERVLGRGKIENARTAAIVEYCAAHARELPAEHSPFKQPDTQQDLFA